MRERIPNSSTRTGQPAGGDGLALASHDDEVRRLVEQADGLLVLEALAERDPDDAELLQRLATARFDAGDGRGAVRALRRARRLSPDSPTIAEDLRAAGGHLVPDWHFPMLGDAARNGVYRQAIERAVWPGAHVVEIGAGSALLSMFAARAGARRVTACEVSGVLADTAAEIVRRNGYDDRVDVVHRHSADVHVGVELPRRADVLVSELLDPTLLAEGVLPSVRDARARLLSPDACVLPRRAVVRAVLMESPSLARAAPLGEVEGLDLSPMEELRDGRRGRVTRLASEPVRLLSQPRDVLEIDLSDPGPAGSVRRSHSHLTATEPGVVHALGWWFDLWLDDRTVLSTGPGEELHWGQVVHHLDRHLDVERGSSVALAASHDDEHIWFELPDR